MGCSPQQLPENLKKCRKRRRKKTPRPPPQWRWRSTEESRLVRMFVWQWLLGRGPHCGMYVLAKWLGVWEYHLRYLKKRLPLDEAAFEREVQQNGAPTLEALREARIKSRSMRAQGLLRTQPPFKEIIEPGFYRPKSIPTKPSPVTLVLDGKIPLEPPGRNKPWLPRPKKKRSNRSAEVARENLKKGRANWRPPRPWRSPSESRLMRMFVWQWLLGRGPKCSQHALARWLGISPVHVRWLRKRLPLDDAAFLREVARTGMPTLQALKGARQDSRLMRELGLLRTQRPYKTVTCEWKGLRHYEMIRTKPNNVTLVLDGVTPLEPPGTLAPPKAELGYVPPGVLAAAHAAPSEFSTRMWQLRMKEERKKKMQPVMPRRSRLQTRR